MTAAGESKPGRETVEAFEGSRLLLERVAGWALAFAGSGILYDSWSSLFLDTNGSVGLIPAYVGFTVGAGAFAQSTVRSIGITQGTLVWVGVLGSLVFWYSYPERATFGGLGSICVGIAMLWLPQLGRLASPLWIGSGVLGIPRLVEPGVSWGFVSSFSLLGAAMLVTGVSLLLGVLEGHSCIGGRALGAGASHRHFRVGVGSSRTANDSAR